MESVPVSTIFRGINLSQQEVEFIQSKFEEVRVKKGDLILNAGQLVP